jgi:hypothetical protein
MDPQYPDSSVNYREISDIEGILRLDDDSGDVLTPIFRFGKPLAAHSIVNLEGKSRPEIALLQVGTVYYLSDSFANTQPVLGDIVENPCFTSPIRLNSTVYVSLAVTDADSFYEGDTVSARAQFYLGESFVQDSGWSAEGTSGTVFPFYFSANQTVSTAILRLTYRDSVSPRTEHTKDLTFAVNTNGVSFGQACTVVYNATAEAAANTTESIFGTQKDPLPDNALSQSVAATSKATGLGTTVTWYVFMLFLGLAIYFGAVYLHVSPEEIKYIYGLIAFVELGMVIVGTKLGFVPVSTIIIITVVGIIIVAVTISRKMTPG